MHVHQAAAEDVNPADDPNNQGEDEFEEAEQEREENLPDENEEQKQQDQAEKQEHLVVRQFTFAKESAAGSHLEAEELHKTRTYRSQLTDNTHTSAFHQNSHRKHTFYASLAKQMASNFFSLLFITRR